MSAPSASLELRERSILDVLDLAVRFMSAHAKKYAALAGLVVVPGLVVSWISIVALGPLSAWGVALALGLAAQVPFTLLASRLVFEDEVPLRAVLADATGALGRTGLARFIQVFFVALGASLFGFPAFWPATTLFFVPEVVILERASASETISRANQVGAQRRGETLLAVLLLLGLEIAFLYLAELAGRAVFVDFLQVTPGWVSGLPGRPLAIAGYWLFVPYRATARFLLYVNVRTREEGWDVQTRFAALAARYRREAKAQPMPRSAA
jgi:hypothetical protein